MSREERIYYYLEARRDGSWVSAGHPEASVFASATAARRALARVVRGGGAERAQLRIRRVEWSKTLVRYLEAIL